MRERAVRSTRQDWVRVFPTMSRVMLAVGANGAKSKMKFPDVPSMVRVAASMTFPPRRTLTSAIWFLAPRTGVTPMTTRVCRAAE